MAKHISNRRLGSAAAVAAGALAPLLAGTMTAQAQAASAAPAAPPPKPWQNKISAGLTLSSGNSDSVQATVSAETQRKWERDELRIYGQFGYGKTKDKSTGEYIKSDDYVFADAQWNHLFTPKLYGGLRVGYRHDDIADLEYRFTISPLLGYYFIKNERTLLNVEAGPSYVFEKQAGDENDYLALRFAQRFEHKFNDKVRLWEFVEYLPEAKEWTDNYIINAEVGVEAMLSKALSLRVVAQNTYDSEPAPGRESNDFKLIAGVTYTFGL